MTAEDETKAQDNVRTTDIAPLYRKSWSSLDVKVEITGPHARITSKDGRVAMVLPAGLLERKFRKGETLPPVSFFKARMVTGAGSLEIEDRIHDPKKQW